MINNIYYLPPWVSARTYVDLAQQEGLQVRTSLYLGWHGVGVWLLVMIRRRREMEGREEWTRPRCRIHPIAPLPISSHHPTLFHTKKERAHGGLVRHGQTLLARGAALLLQPARHQGLPPLPQRPEGRASHPGAVRSWSLYACACLGAGYSCVLAWHLICRVWWR